MTKSELFSVLKKEFEKIVSENGLKSENIKIRSMALSAEEAIGITKRKDYPILDGKEIMLQADCKGSLGQAFTSAPAAFAGSLEEILNSDIEGDEAARALFIAAMNAVMRHLGMIEGTVHCKNDGPELCAQQFVPYLKEHYGSPKIVQVGYQPALIEQLSSQFELRVLDLNPSNVGEEKCGVKIEHGINDYKSAVTDWAELVLCTGSTLANGSIVDYMDIGKEVIFFGTTLAGAAKILGLKRACFESA